MRQLDEIHMKKPLKSAAQAVDNVENNIHQVSAKPSLVSQALNLPP